jgi:hypothetical protein
MLEGKRHILCWLDRCRYIIIRIQIQEVAFRSSSGSFPYARYPPYLGL